MSQKTAIITGASGGFGKAFTKQFLKEGYYVIATVRNEEKRNSVLEELSPKEKQQLSIVLLDVANCQSVKQLETFLEDLDRIDVLVNNAGFAVAGFAEELSIKEYMYQFETNFFGVVRVTNTVIPFMRKQRFGRIINISSISGLIGFPGISPYVSSKFALEGYSESLRLEVKPFGIDVVLVEPGSFQTNIWTSGTYLAEKAGNKESPYSKMFMLINERLKRERSTYGDPLSVAELVTKTAGAKHTPPLRLTVGKGVRLSLFLKRMLPWKFWEKIVLDQLFRKK